MNWKASYFYFVIQLNLRSKLLKISTCDKNLISDKVLICDKDHDSTPTKEQCMVAS